MKLRERKQKVHEKPFENVDKRSLRTPLKDCSNLTSNMLQSKTTKASTSKVGKRVNLAQTKRSVRLSRRHVPVYLQAGNCEERQGDDGDDLYKFDEVDDVEGVIKKKKQKKRKKVVLKRDAKDEAAAFFFKGKMKATNRNVFKKIHLKEAFVPLVRLSEEVIKRLSERNRISASLNESNMELDEIQLPIPDGTKDLYITDRKQLNRQKPENHQQQTENPIKPTTQLSPTKINIISNITVTPSIISSPKQFNQPIANSTFVSESEAPWRLNLPIKRNPHILKVKRDALPYVDQESIWDASVLEKSSRRDDNSVSESSKRSLKQSNLLSFVGKELRKKVEVLERSLFDADEYSPLKSGSPEKQISVENVEDSCKLRNSSVKRKILGEITSNTSFVGSNTKRNDEFEVSLVESHKDVSEAKENKSPQKESPKSLQTDINCCFGFISTNESRQKIAKKTSLELPVRLPVVKLVDILKTAAVKQVIEGPRLLQSELEKCISSSSDESEREDDIQENNGNELRLFEDVSVKPSPRKYPRKFRRQRVHSVASDASETEETDKRKHRKDIRTAAEELEAERWAKQFNKMCAEVENYELEVE